MSAASDGRARSAIVCILAIAPLFAASWIVLPGPTETLIRLSVGAPELSLWLIVLALLLAVMSIRDARRQQLARVALLATAVTVALAALPLVRFRETARRAEASMIAALGVDYHLRAPAQVRQRMRPRRLVFADLFRGLAADDADQARVLFTAPDGTSLAMTIYRPASGSGHPAIVQIHGGAWQRGSADDDAPAARYFAARGYVVFAIEYRLAQRSRWPAAIEDVRAALSWIRSHGAEHGADPSRLAIVGRSAGAQLALVAAYGPGQQPRAVVSYYGPTDLAEGHRDVPRPDPLHVQSLLETYIGGPPDQFRDAYRDASPVSYATRRLPPTLLLYGARDHIVLPRFGRELHERLRATGTPSVLIEIPWADHAFDAVPFGPSGQLTLYYVERFLAVTCR